MAHKEEPRESEDKHQNYRIDDVSQFPDSGKVQKKLPLLIYDLSIVRHLFISVNDWKTFGFEMPYVICPLLKPGVFSCTFLPFF